MLVIVSVFLAFEGLAFRLRRRFQGFW
jgi:hypothetical protein